MTRTPTQEKTPLTPQEIIDSPLLHNLLVTSDRMQAVPAPVVLLLLVAFSSLAGFTWALRYGTSQTTISVAGGVLVFCLIDWLALWMLPRAGRSFGPDRPSAMALGLLHALVSVATIIVIQSFQVLLIVNLGITLVAIYSTWIAPFRLGVTVERYPVTDWTATDKPVRMLHIGDLHLERITARERHLNRLIADLKPDLIVFSGDFVNITYVDDPVTEQQIQEIVGEWQAPLGVFAVPGTFSVEPLDRVRQFVAPLDNIRLLEDEWVTIETSAGHINLLGMVTTHHLPIDQDKLRSLTQDAPGDGLRLLLTHAPDVAPEANDARYDLYVCGHTHGGQIRFPFIGAIFTASALGSAFVMGRRDLEHVTVYTSRGVGLEGLGAPRARFLCPPEIILWELYGSQM